MKSLVVLSCTHNQKPTAFPCMHPQKFPLLRNWLAALVKTRYKRTKKETLSHAH
jgi:hypothetical protein